jgi:hypothetical protein
MNTTGNLFKVFLIIALLGAGCGGGVSKPPRGAYEKDGGFYTTLLKAGGSSRLVG